jgi:AraC-like DNA-binding protein
MTRSTSGQKPCEHRAMTTTRTDFGYSRFSSDDLRPADRVPFYVDVMGQMLMRFDKEPVGERFSCKADFCRLPNLSIASFAMTAVRANRTRAMTEGASDLFLQMQLEGAAKISQRSREVSISRQSILASSEYPSHAEATSGRVVLIGMPRAVLAPMLSNLDAALMSVIPSTIEPLRLLTGYIDLLIRDPTLIDTPEVRRLAAHHVHDLVAMALGAKRDAGEIAAGRGLRIARMNAIKADIAKNLAEDVTAASLAARHRLSPRYIRKLFEGENTSLSQYVLRQRLIRVHRLLTDPQHAARKIGDIGLAVGFADISTFNREFRRCFNATPSDVRAAGRDNAGGSFVP